MKGLVLKKAHLLVVFICCFVQWQQLSSQIISTSTPSLYIDSIGWQGNFDLYFFNSHNSVNVLNLKAGSATQYLSKNKKNRYLSLNSISQMIMKSDRTTSKDDRGVQHFRYNYILSKKWEIETFTQAQFNEPLKIGFRGLLGSGMRFVWHKDVKEFIYSGFGAMYDYEKEHYTTTEWHEIRGNFYTAINRSFGKKIKTSLDFYYQPVFRDLSDFRASSTFSFEMKATEKLGFKIGLNLEHDSSPIEDPEINPFNYTLMSGLSLFF